MKVKVTNVTPGFFGFCEGHRRRFGDVFSLADPANFSPSWMEKVEEPKPKAKKKAVAKKKSSSKIVVGDKEA
jgi:hypothetical protein